jgi:hypothetical protein
MLKLIKQKESSPTSSSSLHPISKTPGYYSSAELYSAHAYKHEYRQLFRKDKESLLLVQIKQKQEDMKMIENEVKELKTLLVIVRQERDVSSDEEMSKAFYEAIEPPPMHKKGYREKTKSGGPDKPDTGEREASEPEQQKFKSIELPGLNKMSGPKFLIKLLFCPPEYSAYEIDCLID